MGKHRKWFWISGLFDNKRDILLNGMILSGTNCTPQGRASPYYIQATSMMLPWALSRNHMGRVTVAM